MQSSSRYLLRNSGALFVTLIIVGMPLPVLPLYVHDSLGYGSAMVGVAIGAHFLATVFCRGLAGKIADTHGGRPTTLAGIFICSLSGLPYLCLELSFLGGPEKFALILLGRACLGIGHSLLGTGTLAWGFGLVGPLHAGRVMAWTGMCTYGAMAAGAPLGLFFWGHWGVLSLGAATCLFPLAAFLFNLNTPATPVLPGERVSLGSVFRRIWKSGACLALHATGFAVISAFISLHFAAKNWEHAGLALSCFGLSFVLVRAAGGELPDRADCKKLTLCCLGGETLGLALLFLAAEPWQAFAGVSLTGLSCSLLFPSIGVQVLRGVPGQARGTAVGGAITFQDASLGLSAPLTGLLVPHFGYPAVFFTAACAAAAAFCIAWGLPSTKERNSS